MSENKNVPAKKEDEVTFQPALRQIGTTECPICRTRVTVFLTKTNRPFVNCGYCSGRIFYNGKESVRLLKKRMKPVEDSQSDTKFPFL